MLKLEGHIIKSFKSALEKLTGYERRIFAAELAMKYFGTSARKTESILGISRDMVQLGIYELQSGFECVDDYSTRGRKKKKKNTNH